MTKIVLSPFFLVFSCIVLGQLLGQVKIKGIRLGSSAVMFAGIFISYALTNYLLEKGIIEIFEGYVPSIMFQLSLIGFIVAVGLLASKNMYRIIKEKGVKFLVLAFIITISGAASTLLFSFLVPDLRVSILGTYVGALTSSPGLAAALESVANTQEQALIGVGYSISYMPGVAAVVIFVQLLGKKRKKKVDCIKDKTGESTGKFSITSFACVCLVGLIIGNISVPLGNYLGSFSLGITGGVLISSLFLGSVGKCGLFDFRFNSYALAIIRDISLNAFLAIVGLNFGYNAVNLIKISGFQLLIFGLLTALICILLGYYFGRKILKLPMSYVIGGICGGMTSTPGLAAAIESLDDNEVAIAYGATYPFALLFMILFVKILVNI